MICTWCGEELDEQERESPRTDSSGVICDACHHDVYEFTCCWCQEYGGVDVQHDMLVVAEEVSTGGYSEGLVKPGVYKVLGGPYHGGPLIGDSYLFGDQLEWLAALPESIDTGMFPCGHLCQQCQQRITQTAEKEPTAC